MDERSDEQVSVIPAQVVDSLTLGVLVLDTSGRVVSANPEATRLLGWTSAQLVGHDIHDTVHQHSHRTVPPAQPCALLDAARTSLSARQDSDLFVRGDGALLPVAWVADPIPGFPTDTSSSGATASPQAVVVRFVDVTDAQVLAVTDAASREQDRAALWDAQQSVTDLGWIAELTRVMSSTLDETEALSRMARLLTPRLADICVVDVVDDDGDLHRLGGSAAAGVETEQGLDLDAVLREPAVQHHPSDTATRGTVAAQAVSRLDAAAMADPTVLSAPSRLLLRQLGARSLLIVPLAARNRMVGLAGLIRLTDDAYTDEDMLLAADIGRRAGLVLDNNRLYQAEQRMAEKLQVALLPAVRSLPHLDVAARYRPAADRNRVGGDWYDVFTCPQDANNGQDGDTHILVVGDVAGHDLPAATTMAALRNLVRGVAVTGTGGPAVVLTTVDTALPVLDIAGTATVTVLRATRTHGGWTLTWSNAGHPPSVLLDPTGRSAALLDERPDPLLGTRTDPDRHDQTVHASFGSSLILYTDGLIERRREDIDRGLQRLRHAATGDPTTAADLLDRIVTAMPSSPDDDTAVLVARLL